MLVILSSLPDASEAAQTAQRALAAAARPTGMRFAVPEACREGFGQGDALFYSGEEPLEAVLPLLTDETFFLHLMGAHGFAPKWDARLYAALRHVCGPALLSASVSPPVEGTPSPRRTLMPTPAYTTVRRSALPRFRSRLWRRKPACRLWPDPV